MNPRLLELALKKQRLQMQAATQRLQMAQHLQALGPAFATVDSVAAAARWLKAHPQWLVGASLILLVTRPRALFRWLRRGFFAWQLVRRVRAGLASLFPSP